MNESLTGVVVGQQLWFVPKQNGRREQPRFMTVTKVGRTWLQLSEFNLRAEIETGLVFECHSRQCSLGQCYVDRDRWQAEDELRSAWDAFRRHVDGLYNKPKLVTLEWLTEAIRVIGLK